MKRFLAVFFTVAILSWALSCGAVTFTYQVLLGGPGGYGGFGGTAAVMPGFVDWQTSGAVHTTPGPANGYWNQFEPIGGSRTYDTPTGISFGNNITLTVPPNTNYGDLPFNAQKAWFAFQLDQGMALGATARTFEVEGDIVGPSGGQPRIGWRNGVPFSEAFWRPAAVYDVTGGALNATYNTIENDPGGALSVLVDGVHIVKGGIDYPFTFWVNQARLAPPTAVDPYSVNGYVKSVPEPGALALLLGSGVSGSVLLLRRRRSVK